MAVTPAAAGAPADPFADCRRALADRPDDYDAAYCFYQTTLAGRLWNTSPAVLDALIAEHPANFWLPLTLGHVHRGRDSARAEAAYRRALEGFQRAGHAEGEVVARVSLRDLLFPLGRAEEASRQIDAVVAIGSRSNSPLVRSRAWIAEAMQLEDSGGDLGRAYRLLKQAQSEVFPDGPYRVKRTLLNALGTAAFRLGRIDEALATYEELDALAATAGEARLRASAQYNIVNTTGLKELMSPSAGARRRIVTLTERALATAIDAQSDELIAKGHRGLAELLAAEPASRAAALAHAERCGALAAKLRLAHDEAVCAWVEASLAGATDTSRREAAERRAVEATTRARNPRTDAFSAGRRMRLSWDTKPAADAILDGLAALDVIERLRDLQHETESGAELFSAWTLDYYWLSGRLLQRAAEDDLARAFAIAERLRGRMLLEQLGGAPAARAGARTVPADGPLLESIAAVQRRLLDPRLQPAERAAALRELEQREREAQEAERLAAVAAGRRAPQEPFADLDTVQRTLAPDEALLAFQVGLWETYEGQFGGGSWLVMLTRNDRSVFELPDRSELAGLIPVYAGLLASRDGLDAAAGARLHETLLGPALRRLPPAVTRLVVVPDGVLHQLPFDALRSSATEPPLAARYELVTVPSATLWRRWRMNSPAGVGSGVLALADPALSGALESGSTLRNAALQQGLRVGRLPYARREARAIGRYLGTVDVLEGDGASERAVKSRDLRRYGLLHFAAHAVADDARPARSAVLLAPGDAREDGLLQAREIESLDLDGRVVVLSACQSAGGLVRSGEGVLSLARAFFAAGAHAVIGSRWPIRDEDAAWIFDAFYRHVGEGASLSAALKQAKVDAIASGRPASAWAGVVLLGSGDIRPAPDGTRPRGTPWDTIAGAVVALIVAAVGTLAVTRYAWTATS